MDARAHTHTPIYHLFHHHLHHSSLLLSSTPGSKLTYSINRLRHNSTFSRTGLTLRTLVVLTFSRARRSSLVTCARLNWLLVSFYRVTACNATQGIDMRKLSVCLSVRPSVKRVDCDKTKGTCAHILIQWKIVRLSSLTRRTVGEGNPFYLKILRQTDPVGAKTPIFNQYSLVAPAVTTGENRSINKKVQWA